MSGYEVVSDDFVVTLNEDYGTVTLACPAGKVPVSAGWDFVGNFTSNLTDVRYDLLIRLFGGLRGELLLVGEPFLVLVGPT